MNSFLPSDPSDPKDAYRHLYTAVYVHKLHPEMRQHPEVVELVSSWPLGSTAEEEAAYAVCQSRGLSRELWQELTYQQRITHLNAYLLGANPSSSRGEEIRATESVTGDEHTVLCALRDALPERPKVVDLEARSGVSRKTLTRLLRNLANRGLVDYEAKARKGATITGKGLSLLGSP